MALYVATADATALVAATAKTLIAVQAGAQDRLTIVQWWVEFDGATATAVPVKVELIRATTNTAAGTRTALGTTNNNPYRDFEGTSAFQTANSGVAYSAEPTWTTQVPLELHRVPPTSGIMMQYPLGREPSIPGGSALQLRVTAAAIVNATYGVVWDE
jgi:hypothetical protein